MKLISKFMNEKGVFSNYRESSLGTGVWSKCTEILVAQKVPGTTQIMSRSPFAPQQQAQDSLLTVLLDSIPIHPQEVTFLDISIP